MTSDEAARPRRAGPGRRRLALAVVTILVAAVDLTAKAWAERGLPAAGIEAGPVDLRLGYNPGVAFSVGADAPAWLVVAVTGGITTAIAVVAWRAARQGSRMQLAALALILGGAIANLVDRAADGVVTDYLHTGWWPTFNLADTAIVTGALLFALTAWQPDRADRRDRSSDAAPTAAHGAAAAVSPARTSASELSDPRVGPDERGHGEDDG